MLTEHEARELLRLAGGSVEVGPMAPVTASPRRWPAVAAAVAAAAAVVLVVALTGSPGSDRDEVDPGPVAPSRPGAAVLDDDQVPSVFGLTGDSARVLLQDSGWSVRVVADPTCDVPPGRAQGTRPATGTRLEPGRTVALRVSETPAAARCASQDPTPWQLLDLAHGHDTWPALAEEVALYADGAEVARLTGDLRTDRGSWQLVLERILDAARHVEQQGASYATPELGQATLVPREGACRRSVPAPLRGREAQRMTIAVPIDGSWLCEPTFDLYLEGGRLTAVAAYTTLSTTDDQGDPLAVEVPIVIGMTQSEAVQRLEAAGLVVDVIAREPAPGCPQVAEEIVVLQDSHEGETFHVGDTVAIHLRDRCGGLPPETQAFTFASFVDDPGAYHWADTVDLYVGNELQKTLTGNEAIRHRNWDMCLSYGERACPISPLRVLRQLDERPVVTRSLAAGVCADELAPEVRREGEEFAVLTVAEPRSCLHHVEVQVWVRGNDITAVNLLLGSP